MTQRRRLTFVSLCALAFSTDLPALSVRNNSPSDNLRYPGQSIEARRYDERWDAYMRRLPVASTDPDLDAIDWMRGSWTAQARDFPASMQDPSTAELGPRTAAKADWTIGHRWLRISFVAEPWHAEWNYYLGHDPIARRWVLQYIAGPSLNFIAPMTAAAWNGDRLTFSPVAEIYKGLRSTVRFVILRAGHSGFRIVTEVKMHSGKFVAMDDVLFTRDTAVP
jgi:hypothetical protein